LSRQRPNTYADDQVSHMESLHTELSSPLLLRDLRREQI
jgi:hypothetical protein